MSATKTIKAFISYSHKDEKYCLLLREHLAPMIQEGIIDEWYDRKIMAGEDWDSAIKEQLLASEIILLLVTSSFLSSGYINSIEMELAIKQYKKGAARVIPIILKPVCWKTTLLSPLQALPVDARPVTTWKNRDQAFVNIVQGIRMVVCDLQQGSCLDTPITTTPVRSESLSGSQRNSISLSTDGISSELQYSRAKSLIAVDIDDFTVINRKFGQKVGGAIKEKISWIISNLLSRAQKNAVHDWIVPYSDEHYILVDLSEEDAIALANHLRQCIWKFNWNSVVSGLVVSVSCGVSSYRAGDAPEDVVIRALLGVKTGKLKSKNRVYRGPFFSRNSHNSLIDRAAFMELVEYLSGDFRTYYKGYIDDERVILSIEDERRRFASRAISTIAHFINCEEV